MYKDFARLYDELMDDFDYENWFSYIRDIFNKYKIRPKTVLEMACGTGNLSLNLAKEEYKLTCFDLSDEMLSIAQKKLKGFRNVKLFKQDMTEFNLKTKYDCILSICDSINYILDEGSLEAVFKNVYDHLEDDGMFIFDINSMYKIKDIIGNNIFIEDRDDIFYIWDNKFDEETNICDFLLTFFYEDGDGLFRRADEFHQERAYSVNQIKEALEKSAFKSIDVYEAFTFSEIKDNSERINFVVRK